MARFQRQNPLRSFILPCAKETCCRFLQQRASQKKLRTTRSLPTGSNAKQTSALSQKQNQKTAKSAQSRLAALSSRPHHTPPEMALLDKERAVTQKVANQKRSASQTVATPRPHHTPPVPKVSAAIRPHHTPPKSPETLALKLADDLDPGQPEAPITTAKIPLPLQKPTQQLPEAGKIGTIISPARAVEPSGRLDYKKRAPSSATAGFAVSHTAKTGHATAHRPEKAPLFKPKPSKSSRPVHQSRCLALALYYEARADGTEAQIGLAKVIMSRVKSRRYPNTICGVVYQNAHLIGNCAFSFACDGRAERPENSVAWAKSRILALSALCGRGCSQPKGETPSVRNAKQGAQSTARRASNQHRQITDRQMKNMGRDGVNAFSPSTTPVF